MGIGITLSPVLGSLVYTSVGFSTTFYIFGSAMAPMSLLILCALPSPKQVRQAREAEAEAERDDALTDREEEAYLLSPKSAKRQDLDVQLERLTYSRLLCN